MFYCNPCGTENGWPINTPVQSNGPCELCRKHALCNDVPSSRLPDPKVVDTARAAINEALAPKRDERTGELFNESRADRAQAALDAYIEFTGDAPDESHFRDLLCDLRHLAARDGAGDRFDGQPGFLTFDEANEVAGRCFEDEEDIEENADDVEEVDAADVVGADFPGRA
jgi:hypothetical protein